MEVVLVASESTDGFSVRMHDDARAIYSTKLTGFRPQKAEDPGGARRGAQRCGGGCGRLAGSFFKMEQPQQWMPMVSKWNEVPRGPRTRHVYFPCQSQKMLLV